LLFAFVFAFLLSSFAEGGGSAFALALAFALNPQPRLSHLTTMLSQQKTPSFRPKRSEVEKSASPPQPRTPHRKAAKTFLITLITATALTLSPPPAHPQGCTQCLDKTAATPPATQRAYRHAILLLTLTAGGLFATTLALFKRRR
jgi:hypothetical protein